jgi:lipopolysaccharide export LptBFGC system permease protein LptF
VIHFVWALKRSLLWTGASTGALAALAVLVDSVENGARLGRLAGTGVKGSAFALALLHLPEHLVVLAPIAAALGSAIAVAGTCRSGEWQGVASTGLGPVTRLMPAFAGGCLVAALALAGGEWLVPSATLAGSRLEATLLAASSVSAPGSALPESSGGWLALPGLVIHAEPAPGGFPAGKDDSESIFLGPTVVWRIREPALVARWEAGALRWDGRSWEPEGEAALVTWPGALSADEPPWTAIPAPEALGGLLGSSTPSARSLDVLRLDPSPQAKAEIASRLSRALCTGPLALISGAIPAILGPEAWVLLVAVAPAFAAETAGIVLGASASQGATAPWLILAARMAVTIVAGGLLVRPLRRPGASG